MSIPARAIEHSPTAEQTLWLLQIEDNPGDARLLLELLKDIERYRFELSQVDSVASALETVTRLRFDVVLLDLSLPDSQGISTLETLRAVLPDTPIIVLTGNCDEKVALEAVHKGAQDYLLKNQLSHQLLMRTIRYAIDRKQAELDLSYLAQYDSLTGLANRSLFHDRLQQAVIRAQRNQEMLALLFLDLDRFKNINDGYGHHIGDQLLKVVAMRLLECVRKGDTIARFGGDEFVVLLESVQDESAVTAVAEKIIYKLSQPYYLDKHTVFTTVSIGISMESGGAIKDTHGLMRNTDMAMYRAKHNGRNNFKYFTSELRTLAETRLSIERDLRVAIKQKELLLHYQPQIDVPTNTLIGAEVLLRWQHPHKGMVHPATFISVLEETGLIVPVGEWILRTACEQWHQWQLERRLPKFAALSVNLSPRQFRKQQLVSTVKRVLASTHLPPELLDLEITENTLLENSDTNIAILNELKRLGVSLTIDDFGTGFCSLGYIKHFPVGRLKVDRSFVKDILMNKQDHAIAGAIINLANNLDMQVIVEGADSREKVELLSRQGCRIFQGYYFSPPLAADKFIQHFEIHH